MTTAAELAQRLNAPTWLCPKDREPMWYKPMLSSGAHVCEYCGWLSFDPYLDGAIRVS